MEYRGGESGQRSVVWQENKHLPCAKAVEASQLCKVCLSVKGIIQNHLDLIVSELAPKAFRPAVQGDEGLQLLVVHQHLQLGIQTRKME